MKLNARLRIKVSSEMFERLKKEATEQEVTLTQLCRNKLKNDTMLHRLEKSIIHIEALLDKI